jgi:hypothetical protein
MKKQVLRLLLAGTMFLVPWVTQAQTIGFTCGFENDSDTAGWTIYNGSQPSVWTIGTAVNNGGTKSLYVSDDGGTSNNYSGGTSIVYAVKTISLDAGGYELSYDWRCQGESNYDYIRVFLAPATATFSAGVLPDGGTSTYSFASATPPAGWISLHGANKLNLQSSWQNYFEEFTVSASGTYNLVFLWANDGSVYNNPGGAIDNVILRQPSCPRPGEITLSNIEATSFDISWFGGGSATQWLVAIDSAGQNIVYDIANDTTYSVTGRAGNTDYIIQIYSLCSTGDTSIARSLSFHSPCVDLTTLPWSESFENHHSSGSSDPDFGVYCMSRLTDATSYYYPYPYNSSTYAHTGNASLYFYRSSSASGYGNYHGAVMPGVDTNIYPISSLRLSFWARESSNTNPVLEVGVLTDPTDMNTFQLVQTININNLPIHSKYNVYFNNYEGTGKYICLRSGPVSNYWYCYVDDLTIEVAPDCPGVENIRISNTTSSSVDISWHEMDTATSYQVFYVPDGLPADSVLSINVNDTLVTLTDLQANTLYNISIAPVCSGTSDTNTVTVRTLCLDYSDTLPYFIGFEDQPTGSSSYRTFAESSCIYRVSDATEYFYPYIGGSSYAHSGTKGLYMYNYWYSGGGYGQFPIVALPRFDSVMYPLNTMQVRFWAKPSSPSYSPVLYVGVITSLDDHTNFIPVDTIHVGRRADWHEFDISLADYTGPHGHIAISYPTSSSSWYCYLDDITIETAPPCARPDNIVVTGISTDTVALDWTVPDASTTEWQITYGPAGFDPTSDSATHLLVTSHPATINGLNPGTDYDVYVYSSCGEGEMSFARPFNFRTPCAPTDTLPYFYGFEGTTTGASGTIDPCWYKFVQNTSTQYPYPSTTNFEGSRSLYFYGYFSNNIKSYAVLPLFEENIDMLQVSFKMRGSTINSYTAAQLKVGVMSNPYDINTFTLIERCNATSTTTWDSFNILLYGYQQAGNYIAFICEGLNSSIYYNYAYLDNVVVDLAPDCGPVTNVQVASSSTSAIVSWTPSVRGTSEGANLQYRHASSTDDSEWEYVTSSGNSAALVNLDTNTAYEVRIFNSCAEGTSGYVQAFFNTLGFSCAPDTTLPASDTIGNINGTTTSTYIPAYSFYNNSLSQQIYLARELTGLGQINSMKLRTSAAAQTRTWYIYLSNTTDSTVPSNWLVPSNPTLVWSGQVNYVANGWTEFEFSTPFEYSGGNILVTIDDQTGSYVSGNAAYTHSLPSGRQSRYNYRDSSPYDFMNMAGEGGYSLSERNDMIFSGYACSGEISTCAAPPALVTGFNPRGATIEWAPGSGEGQWTVYYKQASDTGWTSVGLVYEPTYTFTTLNPGKDYSAKIVNSCTSEERYSIVNFFVPCPKIDSLPFYESFDSYGTGTSVHAPVCWAYGSDYSTSYPYIISTNHGAGTGGSVYMYGSRYSNPDSWTWFALPELDTTVAHMNDVQVVFYAYNSYSGYEHNVVVGVSHDPWDMSTFTPVDTIYTTGQWTLYEVPLNTYADSGLYITFAAYPGEGSSSPYCYPYVDDIWVERIPSCQRPDSVQVSNITTNSVDISFRSRTAATEFLIEYGPFGFTPGTGVGTRVVANSNPFTLTGLPSALQADVYVANICDGGDTGFFSRYPANFTLRQIPASVPYFYDFEDSTEWANWQVNSNTNHYFNRGTAVPAYSGSNSMYVSPDLGATFGTNMNAVVNTAVWRDIDFGTTPTTFEITFRHKEGATLANSYDGLMVFMVDTAQEVVASNQGIISPWGSVNELYRICEMRLDTTWTLARGSLDTVSGVKRIAFFWFNQNTGSSSPWIFGPAIVDDIRIQAAACPRPVNMDVDSLSLTSTSARLFWDGDPGATYRVAYRVRGASASTNTYIDVTTNEVTLTGLSSVTNYAAWVQKLCGTDSSMFSDGVEFQTLLCDGAETAYSYDNSWSATTSTYAPIGYSTYNYSYTQTIIDSAQMSALSSGIITAMSFNPVDGTCGNYFTGMDIYLANVPESDLASGFILPDNTNHQFVQVTNNADLTYTDGGWQMVGFDTSFTWDGHSNVLFAVHRQHGSWSGGANFRAHSCSSVRTRYLYQDSGPYNITSVSGGTTLNLVGDLKLISCVSALCPEPTNVSETHDYRSATITWTGDSADYEVNIKETDATSWPADIAVTANTYTFNGLAPATAYTYRVRTICPFDTLQSDWIEGELVTDSLPCFTPDSLRSIDATNTTVTLDWNPVGDETNWDIHVWYGAFDSIYRVNTRPAAVGGLVAGLTYNATIRPLCGLDLLAGDWSDTISITTAVCPDVTGLTSSNVTATGLTISWDNNTMADNWIIEYGYTGFDQGTGTTIIVNTNSQEITGLECETSYDFYVRTSCGPEWISENLATITVSTLDCTQACDAPYGINTAVTGNSVAVTWTPSEGNTAFEVEYGTHGFSHGDGTVVSTNEPSTTITGLDFNTQYDLYVRALCGDNNYSSWSTMSTFTTETQGIAQAGNASCSIFPNPATSSTTITVGGISGKVKIEVVDMNGRTVATETLECSADCEKTMDVNNLAQGAYFVRVTADQINMVKKLIVR